MRANRQLKQVIEGSLAGRDGSKNHISHLIILSSRTASKVSLNAAAEIDFSSVPHALFEIEWEHFVGSCLAQSQSLHCPHAHLVSHPVFQNQSKAVDQESTVAKGHRATGRCAWTTVSSAIPKLTVLKATTRPCRPVGRSPRSRKTFRLFRAFHGWVLTRQICRLRQSVGRLSEAASQSRQRVDSNRFSEASFSPIQAV